MNKLDTLRKYAEKLSKASNWLKSNEAIAHISRATNARKRKEYIYEFYCSLRILVDLSDKYKIQIKNNHTKNVFPKAPGSKANFPYFQLTNKLNPREKFQICLGVDIKGVEGETNAPDISFQKGSTGLRPTHKHLLMIMDAKFKHKLDSKVAETDFLKVHGMITNLNCEDAETKSSKIAFKEFIGFNGNCLISNGKAFKTNAGHHRLFKVKEITNFEEGKAHKIIW